MRSQEEQVLTECATGWGIVPKGVDERNETILSMSDFLGD